MSGHLPAWMGKSGQRQNDRSRDQERRRAEQVGGRATSGSGSSWRDRGDVQTDEYLEELKYTDKRSFPLKVSDLKLIRKRARLKGKEPRMVIDFPEHGIRAIVEIEDI